jgi:hypothetical protein
LKSSEIGGSVDEVEAQIKKLETFKRASTLLEERVLQLNTNADLLIKQRFASSTFG